MSISSVRAFVQFEASKVARALSQRDVCLAVAKLLTWVPDDALADEIGDLDARCEARIYGVHARHRRPTWLVNLVGPVSVPIAVVTLILLPQRRRRCCRPRRNCWRRRRKQWRPVVPVVADVQIEVSIFVAFVHIDVRLAEAFCIFVYPEDPFARIVGNGVAALKTRVQGVHIRDRRAQRPVNFVCTVPIPPTV